MIFNFISKAKDLFFNDSVAKTGSDNVQGAIEGVKSAVEVVTSDVNGVKSDLNTCIKITHKESTTLAKYDDTMLNLVQQCYLVLSEVLDGVGTYLISVRGDNTAWRYVGILISSNIGIPILTNLVAPNNMSVTLDTTNKQISISNTNTSYDQKVTVYIVKLAG